MILIFSVVYRRVEVIKTSRFEKVYFHSSYRHREYFISIKININLHRCLHTAYKPPNTGMTDHHGDTKLMFSVVFYKILCLLARKLSVFVRTVCTQVCDLNIGESPWHQVVELVHIKVSHHFISERPIFIEDIHQR